MKTMRICHQHTYPKRIAKESSRNKKEMIIVGTLEIQGPKIWVNTIDFPSALQFSKLCLRVEAKIITLFDMVLNVCGGNS